MKKKKDDNQAYKIFHPGIRLKEELKSRGISQKDFASIINVPPSRLSELIKGKRSMTLSLAEKIQNVFFIPMSEWIEMQAKYDVYVKSLNQESCEEYEATNLLAQYDDVISVKTIMKDEGMAICSCKDQCELLQTKYQLPVPQVIKKQSESLINGCFKKSVKTGLDHRMITTWVVLARYASNVVMASGIFNRNQMKELVIELRKILHENNDTLTRVKIKLSEYGIKFSVVKKVEHASIDGYSFFKDGVPSIVVTKRFDRIDNLAFSIMHELYHVYKHLNSEDNGQRINLDEYDNESKEEKEANEFAANALIPPELWRTIPSAAVNPFAIQYTYTKWAEMKKLNKWIVLGRISHETGMYKFKNDASRAIK